MNFFKRSVLKGAVALAFIYSLAFLFVLSLNAQSYSTFRAEMESIKKNANWTLGPLWIDPGLLFNLDYDSNIYGTYGGRQPVSDYVASIAVPVSIYFPLRNRLILSFTDIPEYLYYFKLNSESSFNNSYSLAARLLFLQRLVLSGSYAFNRAKYRVSSEIESRIFQQIEGPTGSLFFETAIGTAVGFIGSTSRYTYQDETLLGAVSPLSISWNRKEDNLRLEFYRPIFVGSSFFFNFGFTEYAFDYPQSRYRDSYSYQAYAGIRFPLLGRARGLLSLGYKNFRPREQGRETYSGPVGNTSVDFRFGRFGLRFQLVRDVPFSYYTDSIFFISTSLGAGLSFYLTRNIRLDYDFFLGKGKYPEGILISLPDGTNQEIQRKDTYASHSGSVVVRILRTTGIGLKINYGKRESNYFVYNTDRWMAGIFLIYDF
jgi:hypothetical protein